MSIDTKHRLMYNVADLQEILGIGRSLAYKLVAMDDFPKVIINNRYYIPAEKLQKWIDRKYARR